MTYKIFHKNGAQNVRPKVLKMVGISEEEGDLEKGSEEMVHMVLSLL